MTHGAPGCPNCKSTSSACRDTRKGQSIGGQSSTRRRRQCRDCGTFFTTYEISDQTLGRIVFPSGANGGSASEPSIPSPPARPAEMGSYHGGQGGRAGDPFFGGHA